MYIYIYIYIYTTTKLSNYASPDKRGRKIPGRKEKSAKTGEHLSKTSKTQRQRKRKAVKIGENPSRGSLPLFVGLLDDWYKSVLKSLIYIYIYIYIYI